MPAYVIYVQDAHGQVHYVGERSSRDEAETSADIYNRDPLSQGFFYVARVGRERRDALAAWDRDYS